MRNPDDNGNGPIVAIAGVIGFTGYGVNVDDAIVGGFVGAFVRTRERGAGRPLNAPTSLAAVLDPRASALCIPRASPVDARDCEAGLTAPLDGQPTRLLH